MRILVIGGGGFLGSELVSFLAKNRKNQIQVVDSFTHGFPKKPLKRKNILSPIVASVGNYYSIVGAMERFQPEAVVHLAAYASRPESLGDFRACSHINYVGTANVAQACMSNRVKPKKLIFASALSAKNPAMHFGISKRAAEDLLISIFPRFPQFGVQLSTLRFAELYGLSNSYTSTCLVNFLVDHMVANQNIALHNVGCKKDFLHVGDAVRALQLALGYENDHLVEVDIGTGQGLSVKELIGKIKSNLDYQGKLHFLENPQVPIEEEIADPSPAKQFLGFEAEADFDKELSLLIAKRKRVLR